MTKDSPDLASAYALEGSDASRQLYADWAETYDATFAEAMDFLIPAHVRDLCKLHGAHGPILDIGAGTGLVGEALKETGIGPIDGLDLSPEMLSVARAKGTYRNLFEADITRPLDLPDRYHTLVSSGTFTHGHVGPEALHGLIDVAAPDALFVLSINAAHFEAKGFAAAFAALPITGLLLKERPIYGPRNTSANAGDTTQMVMFRRT